MDTPLREAFFFVKQQHEWLVDLQSVLDEKEQKYKILYNKFNYQFKKEKKNERLGVYRKSNMKYYKNADIYPEYDDDDEISDITNSYDEFEEKNIYNEDCFAVKNEDMSDDENYDSELNHEHKSSEHTKREQYEFVKSGKKNKRSCDNDDDKTAAPKYFCDNVDETSNDKNNLSQEEKVKQQNVKTKNRETEVCAGKAVDQLFKNDCKNPYRPTCKTCGRHFKTKYNLLQHQMTHTGEKPYECSHCYKKFAKKSTLQRHILTHTGEKPHECKICSMSFRLKTHLKEHKRIHTGEKLYNCTYCSNKFTQKSTLTRHIRTHTGEKPYKCDKCSNAYAHLSSYHLHVVSKHK